MYENKYYLQSDSLSMKRLTPSLLANIIMDNLEHKIFNPRKLKHVYSWYRYVNDMLGCFL